MNQISNEIGGVIHVCLATLLSYMISMCVFLLGGRLLISALSSFVSLLGAIVSTIISLAVLFIGVKISASIMRSKFIYSDKIRVVNVATVISVVVSVLMSLGSIFVASVSLMALINLILGIYVFYSVSRASL